MLKKSDNNLTLSMVILPQKGGLDSVKLNDVLRKLRRQRNLSQENLAYELGIDYTTYNRYEKNASKIQVETLEKIASFYGLTLIQLVAYNEEENPPSRDPFVIQAMSQLTLAIEKMTEVLEESPLSEQIGGLKESVYTLSEAVKNR